MDLSTDRPPSIAIPETIASLEGVAPTELQPPLWEAVDPDALDRVFEGDRSCTVQFRYCGHTVTVTQSDGVSIDEPMGELDTENQSHARH